MDKTWSSSTGSNETGKARVIIIGGGIAGLTAAKELRKISAAAEITIVSDEARLPYYRLNLIRYLSRETDKNSLNIYPGTWYEENRINFISGKAVSQIHKEKKKVELEDGTSLTYDKLVIATGAVPFILPIPGNGLENVITVRTVEDVEYLHEKLQKVESCICIGGGILGLETAAAIARSGVHVILLEGAPWLMPRQLNRNASGVLKKYMQKIGVEVREDVRITEIVGNDSCEGVRLDNGETFYSPLVIITAGVKPDTDLAKKAGLEVDKGLVVNRFMQTSDADIYAAGDVTELSGMQCGLWSIAMLQGKIAALNIAGQETEFGNAPRTNILKVRDLDMISVGEFDPSDDSCSIYEKLEDDRYYSFVLRNGRIIGAIIVGDKVLAIKAKTAVESGEAFADETYGSADRIIDRLLKGKNAN